MASQVTAVSDVTGLGRAWVRGWAMSRGTPAPVGEPWGLRVDVGLPDQVVRHVLPDADEAAIRAVAAAVTEPHTWIKAFVAAESMAAWLGPDWAYASDGFLMSASISIAPVRVPDGYTLTTEDRQGVRYVRVLAEDGAVAAHGQVAPVGAFAVVDRVATDPAHQRRGLGSQVIRSLANTAVEAGARTGVLGASHQGRALYEALGWVAHAPLNGFVYGVPDFPAPERA